MNQDELNKALEEQLAGFFGQMTEHLDKRLDAAIAPIRSEMNEIHGIVDGIAKRLDDDAQERAATNHQLTRHEGWIGQLAGSTGTKLVPEQ